MALKSIMLMITALMILIVPGMLYNNLNNNGMVVSQSQGLTCSTDSQTPTCQISGNVGCQSSSSYCQLSGSSISFLSHTSIFTTLLSGNIFALWSNLNNRQSAPLHGPWDLMGGQSVYQGRANCIVSDQGGLGLTKWTFKRCTESNPDTSNKTRANSQTWANWNANLLGTSATNLAFFDIYSYANNSLVLNCAYQFQLNYTTGGSTTGNTWYGCQAEGGAGSVLTDKVWAWWIAVPYEYGALNSAYKYAVGNGGTTCAPVGKNCYHEHLQFALTSWDTHVCGTTAKGGATPTTYEPFVNTECNQFWQSLNSAVQTPASNSLSFGLLTPIVLFIIGLVLFFLGLGIGIGVGGSVLGTGTQGSLQENEAGSRLAQSLGLGLIIWVPLYSEFSTWFTSGILPYGFDGALGIIALILTGLFFFGVFWRALSRD